ncbi:MAG TPA: hypothetical protein VF049_05090 [Nocardioidaceae bacterium]
MTDAERWLLAAAGAGFTAGWLLLAWWAGAHDLTRTFTAGVRRCAVRLARRRSSGFPSP